MLKFGPVRTKMDFESTDKRMGFIDIDHSNNRLDFSAIRLPVGVIKGGAGLLDRAYYEVIATGH